MPPTTKPCAQAAYISPGPTPVATRLQFPALGLVPFAMMASKDGSYGYEMEIIVPKDSNMKSPTDIKSRTLAFISPTSSSVNNKPSAWLKSEFGLFKDKEFKTVFSGKHDNSVLGLVGAGGIGLQLDSSISILAWTQVSLILLTILATVIVSEWVSAQIRHAII